MNLKDTIRQMAAEISSDIIDIRRHLHRHPELSFHEYETSAFIRNKLDEMQIPWKVMAGTGVVATIHGGCGPGRVIALRADMDALAIDDQKTTDYRSQNPGVMHACGHDAHIAMLLGVTRILKNLLPQFQGEVRLIFQPAEEILPGGAVEMIRCGTLNNPKVDLVIGQHVAPHLPAGTVAVRKGYFMASMDEISIRVKGRGGHGAEPHKLIDPILAASTIVVVLQQLISRKNNPSIPSVLSFGKFQANGTINIVPDKVLLEGTFRSMDEEWRVRALSQVREMATSIAAGLGCECDVTVRNGYPSLFNPIATTERIVIDMKSFLGEKKVLDHPIWMASEDFAYYTHEADSLFYLLGVGEEGREATPLHTSLFDISEKAIETGIGVMVYIVLKFLGSRLTHYVLHAQC